MKENDSLAPEMRRLSGNFRFEMPSARVAAAAAETLGIQVG